MYMHVTCIHIYIYKYMYIYILYMYIWYPPKKGHSSNKLTYPVKENSKACKAYYFFDFHANQSTLGKNNKKH